MNFLATLIFTIILGLPVGSFLSMLIPRLHFEEKGIFKGRSKCPKCKKNLSTRELIPLFSFIFQKGSCIHCKKKISFWYPVIEATTAITYGALFLYFANIQVWGWYAALFTLLLFIFFYDLRYKEIHDGVMIPGIIFAFIASFYIGNPETSLYGALVCSGFFVVQYLASGGKWVGSGDARIGAFIGAMLGLQASLVALFLSYILGSIVGIYLLSTGKASGKTSVPLGPFLVVGSVLAFFYSDQILEWYFYL